MNKRSHELTVTGAEKIRATVAKLRASRKSESTLRTYRSGWKHFTDFCESFNVVALPAEPDTVAGFIADQYNGGASCRSIETRVAAIRHFHIEAGHYTPTVAPIVHETLGGLRRNLARSSDKRRAIKAEEVERIVSKCLESGTLLALRDAAVIAVGFYGALRVSEIAGFDVEDVAKVSEGYVIGIRKSKTDQEGRGAVVALPELPGLQSCPVAVLRRWLECRGEVAGPLFPGFNSGKAGKKLDAIRLTKDGVPLRLFRTAVNNRLRMWARRASVPVFGLSPHSLRIGFVTAAVKAGASIASIQRQTRHVNPQMIQIYTRLESAFEGNAVNVFGRKPVVGGEL